MATKKKLLQAAAGNAGGAALNVEDVFSTYLYNGTATNVAHRIQNGIDLAGEGGLVWIKKRDSNIANTNHYLSDTERGNFYIASNSTNAQAAGDIASYNSDGWTFNASTGLGTDYLAAQSYASWTFRKAKKFFDVVTWTGDGTGTRDIPHNLGTTVGMIVMKQTQSTLYDWFVYHRGYTSNTGRLNVTGAFGSSSLILRPTPGQETTHFQVSGTYNGSGETHVAYLFAHNNNDGGFGPDGDADIIKCGSYTGNGSTSSGPHIDLGFEPQWILVKTATQSGNWSISDTMRGFHHGNQINLLYPHLSNAEAVVSTTPSQAAPTSNGFQVQSSGTNFNTSGQTYIYIAIRRPTAVPTSATEVFDVQTSTSANFVHTTGFDVDLAITGSQDGWARNAGVVDRLRGDGKSLETSNTDAESAGNAGVHEFDRSREYLNSSTSGDQVAWAWKRAPKYMDVVAYTGNGTAGHTVSHNLTVAPEMMWVKRRNGVSSWITYWEPLGATKGVFIDTNAAFTSATYWNDTAPTDSVFTLGNGSTNTSSATFIAYLFATLANISKVGSFSHTNGTNSVVDCGFTSGARFVLLKRTDSADNWDLWDSARGINTGTEPKLVLNTTSNESVTDEIDPDGSGFIYASGGNTGDYIFYAIA